MAITSAICTSYKAEILGGTHASGDTYKMALYTNLATMDAATTAYAATNEVVGTGYTAGGMALTGLTILTSGTTAYLDFSSPVWTAATITARGALIYNSTKTNKAVMVIDFGADKTSTAGDFTVTMPANDAANALIRL